MKRMFEGYNPRDLRRTLILVGGDIMKREMQGGEIPPILRQIEMELNRELARVSI